MVVWTPTGLDGGPFKSGHTRCITKAHHFNTEASLFTLNVPGRSNCLQVHQPAAPCRPCWLWAFKKPPRCGHSRFYCASWCHPPIGERQRAAPRVCTVPSCSYSAAKSHFCFYLRLLASYLSYPDQTPDPPGIFKIGLKPIGNRTASYLLTALTQSHLSSGRTEEILVSMRMAFRRPWGPPHSVGIWTFL